MPYDVLPARLRALIPAKNGQDIFRNVVNSQMAAGKTEEVAFASAWAALQRAGYAKDENGKWVKKTQPTASQVHSPGPMRPDDDEDDEDDRDKVGKKTYQPPESARNNARRVLEWRQKYGSKVKGMTRVGWTRASQLASGKPVSRDTVARMSAFNRHRKNAEVAPEYRDEPWRDRGYVAWLGWGGTSGVDWARAIMGGMDKRMRDDDVFTTPVEAGYRSEALGLNGKFHVRQTPEGQAVYVPGESDQEYLARMAELGGASSDYEDEEEDIEDETEDSDDEMETETDNLLERVISGIVDAAMRYELSKTSDTVIKLDSERRIAWGWASVATVNGELVRDLQGDSIAPDEMSKMADAFMLNVRTAKAMHEGAQVGEVIHSLPLTQELAKALNLSTDREGWIIGMKIHDEDTWNGFKSGKYKGFSIGGKARRTTR